MTPTLPAPTVSNILAQMAAFLADVLPGDVVIAAGQPNRVPEPVVPRFVVMSPPRFERIETNVDAYADAEFTGSIAGTTLTITAVDAKFPNGKIGVGSTVFGANIAAGTQVTEILTGSGQIGTYTINKTQTITPETISAGAKSVTMAAKAMVQLDFHAVDGTSGDLANLVSALMRDEYATNQFANQSPSYGVVPLYADDARQVPFPNDQQQIEWRWVVESMVQANITTTVPMEFADAVALGLVSVDAAFPA